jgi:MraZ protein
MMFRGITALTVDPKGRLAVPARYRDTLLELSEGRMVMTIDTESTCLLLYTVPEWEKIEHKLENLPSFNRAARRIQRLLIGHATEIELDGNGRILVPPLLRDYARLDKRVMLVGQGRKFELWDEEAWEGNRKTWLLEEAEAKDELPDELRSISL